MYAIEVALEIQSRGADLWKEVIQAKYGSDSLWRSNKVSTSYGTGIWRDITNLWEIFSLLMVGNGKHIRFWKDIWLGDTPLTNVFPSIFQIASHPDSTISKFRILNNL